MRTVVVIRTWNVYEFKRSELLRQTYENVLSLDMPHGTVVVDNGSDDGTGELVLQLGGVLGAKTSGRGLAGRGVNLAVAEALRRSADLVVCSDDDMVWKRGALYDIVRFWKAAATEIPHANCAILCGLLEPEWDWNTVRGRAVIGGVKVVSRDSVPGAAWSFPAAKWNAIGPVPEDMTHDTAACLKLTMCGLPLYATDLARHAGAGKSTHGNEPPAGRAVSLDEAS